MTATPRTYAGATQRERQSRRRALLLDTALELVATAGVGSLTVRGICAGARLNDRYFYESYRNTHELLTAMLDDQIVRASAALMGAITASPPDPVLRARAVIGSGLRFLTEDPRRSRLLVESQATEGMRTRRRDLVTMLAKIMADQSRALLGERESRLPDLDLTALTLVAGGLDLVTRWLRGELDISREHLEAFLVELVTAR